MDSVGHSSLPELDGLEMIRRIRSFSDVYILMLTGHADTSGLPMTAELAGDLE